MKFMKDSAGAVIGLGLVFFSLVPFAIAPIVSAQAAAPIDAPEPVIIILYPQPGDAMKVTPKKGTLPAIDHLTKAELDALVKSLSTKRKGGR